jgi:hypothetical protein
MRLSEPFQIGPRLLSALKVGDTWLHLEHVGNADNRMVFRWYVDLADGSEFSEADLKSGMQGCTLQEMWGTFLAFLGAAAEAYATETFRGRTSDNSDLFPPSVAEWAYQEADELCCLQMDIEEGGQVLIHE